MTKRHRGVDKSLAYREHVREAVAALGQYLQCVAGGRDKFGHPAPKCLCTWDIQDHTRQAMIAATACPVCESLGNRFEHDHAE